MTSSTPLPPPTDEQLEALRGFIGRAGPYFREDLKPYLAVLAEGLTVRRFGMHGPVQESRGIALEHILAATEIEDVHRALTDYAAAIRREEAARVLPVLRAVEWARRENQTGDWEPVCPFCYGTEACASHAETCPLAAEITRLEALVGRLCPRCGGAGTTIEGSPVSAQWPEPCPECNGTGSAEALVKEGER